MADYKEYLEHLKYVFDTSEQETDRRFNELNADLDACRNKINSLEKDKNNALQHIESLKAVVAQHLQTIAAQDSNLGEKDKTIEQNKQLLAQAEQRMANLQQDSAEWQQKFYDSESELKRLEADLNQRLFDLQQEKKKKQQLTNLLEDISPKNKELENRLSKQKSEFENKLKTQEHSFLSKQKEDAQIIDKLKQELAAKDVKSNKLVILIASIPLILLVGTVVWFAVIRDTQPIVIHKTDTVFKIVKRIEKPVNEKKPKIQLGDELEIAAKLKKAFSDFKTEQFSKDALETFLIIVKDYRKDGAAVSGLRYLSEQISDEIANQKKDKKLMSKQGEKEGVKKIDAIVKRLQVAELEIRNRIKAIE